MQIIEEKNKGQETTPDLLLCLTHQPQTLVSVTKIDILFEQLATRAYFLAVFDYQDFPIYQINDKKYYPIYTSQLEMNKDQKCKNKKGSVYSFDDYYDMLKDFISNLNPNFKSHYELLNISNKILTNLIKAQNELGIIISQNETLVS